MFYSMDIIRSNIYVLDSHTMELTSCSGYFCFIIGHHVKDQMRINETVQVLLTGGFRYFNIFGQQADYWQKSIDHEVGKTVSVQVEASRTAREEMSYNLAMYSSLHPKQIYFVLSDDEFFTEYLIEDVNKILDGKASFTIFDWQKFRFGYEFNYHGKDAVVSVSNGVIIGFLGKERRFDSIFEGFQAKLFDGHNFYEIWDELHI